MKDMEYIFILYYFFLKMAVLCKIENMKGKGMDRKSSSMRMYAFICVNLHAMC